MEIEIKVFDASGNLVRHDISEAQTATDDEINEMVSLIENGCRAHLAASLVLAPK